MILADRYESAKEKLGNREKLVIANLMNVTSPLMLAAFEKADCILLDKEHGVYGTEELIPMTMQARNMGIPTIVRVEDTVYHLIAKAMGQAMEEGMRAETVNGGEADDEVADGYAAELEAREKNG